MEKEEERRKLEEMEQKEGEYINEQNKHIPSEYCSFNIYIFHKLYCRCLARCTEFLKNIVVIGDDHR